MTTTEGTVHYLEDFAASQKYRSGKVSVDAAAIKAFANAFDPQPFHLDEQAARATFFGGLASPRADGTGRSRCAYWSIVISGPQVESSAHGVKS